MRRPLLVVLGALVLIGGGVGLWWVGRAPTTVDRTRELEAAWTTLRDAIVEGDDDLFFRMHSRAARKKAVDNFPEVRARYLASSPDQRAAFRSIYGFTEPEFLDGDPESIVKRMIPIGSGWKDRAGMYAVATIKDIRINEMPPAPGSGDGAEAAAPSLEGVVVLDISRVLEETGTVVPDSFLPTIVFVLEDEGWRRKAIFPGGGSSDGR